MNDAFGVSKGAMGEALVRMKLAQENRKAKPKKGNMVLRPLKTLKALNVVKSACDCKVCEAKGLKCSECPKCSAGKNGASG